MGLGAAVGGIVDAIGSFVGGLGAADLGAGLAGAAGDFTAGGAEGLFAAGGSGLADVGAGAAGAGLAGAAGDFTAGGAEGLYAAGGSGLADAGTAAGALGAAGVDGFGATSAAAPAAGVSGAAGAATPASAALGTAPVATAGPSAASISPIAGTGPTDLTAAGTTAAGTAASPAATAASGIGAPVAGGAAGGGTAAGASGGLGSTWNAITGALTGPTAKTLGVGVAGLGLARDLIEGNSLPKGSNEIQSLAAQSASQGQILQSYLETGTLPPAVQASVNAATQAGISAIQSKYASMGVAPGSSGEVADIASLRNQAVYQGANLADQLLQQGISETQLSGQLYEQLVQTQLGLDQETSQAIGGLATALSGGIKLGNSGVVVA